MSRKNCSKHTIAGKIRVASGGSTRMVAAMAETDLNVAYVAELARLELTEDETKRYQKQLEDVLSYMKAIDQLDVTGIEPTAHAAAVFNVMREDVSRPGLEREEALSNAPHEALDQFAVVKVLD